MKSYKKVVTSAAIITLVGCSQFQVNTKPPIPGLDGVQVYKKTAYYPSDFKDGELKSFKDYDFGKDHDSV